MRDYKGLLGLIRPDMGDLMGPLFFQLGPGVGCQSCELGGLALDSDTAGAFAQRVQAPEAMKGMIPTLELHLNPYLNLYIATVSYYAGLATKVIS